MTPDEYYFLNENGFFSGGSGSSGGGGTGGAGGGCASFIGMVVVMAIVFVPIYVGGSWIYDHIKERRKSPMECVKEILGSEYDLHYLEESIPVEADTAGSECVLPIPAPTHSAGPSPSVRPGTSSRTHEYEYDDDWDEEDEDIQDKRQYDDYDDDEVDDWE